MKKVVGQKTGTVPERKQELKRPQVLETCFFVNMMISNILPSGLNVPLFGEAASLYALSPLDCMDFPHLIILSDGWSFGVRFFIMPFSPSCRFSRARNIQYAAGGL
ncbi:hypothetical protein NPS48_15695 [Leclercia pneumoniae]|nr:hypothetical protein [Leclercia pneumoniae]MCV2512922.1 hypothetical protein [Leclercia pneumoniae]